MTKKAHARFDRCEKVERSGARPARSPVTRRAGRLRPRVPTRAASASERAAAPARTPSASNAPVQTPLGWRQKPRHPEPTEPDAEPKPPPRRQRLGRSSDPGTSDGLCTARSFHRGKRDAGGAGSRGAASAIRLHTPRDGKSGPNRVLLSVKRGDKRMDRRASGRPRGTHVASFLIHELHVRLAAGCSGVVRGECGQLGGAQCRLRAVPARGPRGVRCALPTCCSEWTDGATRGLAGPGPAPGPSGLQCEHFPPGPLAQASPPKLSSSSGPCPRGQPQPWTPALQAGLGPGRQPCPGPPCKSLPQASPARSHLRPPTLPLSRGTAMFTRGGLARPCRGHRARGWQGPRLSHAVWPGPGSNSSHQRSLFLQRRKPGSGA